MPQPARLPDHVYIPGKTARPPEGWFDDIRDTAQAGMTSDALAASDAFQTGLVYLEQGYFWEAHEVLEPVWMALEDGSDARKVVQALIQLANGRLKLKMGRPKAAHRLAGIARALVSGIQEPMIMTVDMAELRRNIESLTQQTI